MCDFYVNGLLGLSKENGKVFSEGRFSMHDNPYTVGQDNDTEIKKLCHLSLGLDACLVSCSVTNETTYETINQNPPIFRTFFF